MSNRKMVEVCADSTCAFSASTIRFVVSDRMKVATPTHTRNRQEELGQFLTAAPVAEFMASMFGPYFRPFREDFLSNLELHRLHVFESRQAAFRGDSVLQENVIFHAVKGNTQPRKMLVSSSSGEHGDVITESLLPFVEIVHPHDAEKFIHIPSTPSRASAKETMDRLGSSLASLGVTVSDRVADDPDHMIHFNGERFLGPYPDAMPKG